MRQFLRDFLSGVACVFIIWGESPEVDRDPKSGGFEQDRRKLAEDWRKVQRDIQKALDTVK